MKPTKIFYALIWKEWRVVVPLVAGIALVAATLFGITLFKAGDRDGYFFAYLILFPNLVAFGVSALQVGHEDETGTLNWQRSLPVSVSQIVCSKLAVGILAVCCVWLACLLGYSLAWGSGAISRMPNALAASGIAPALEVFRFFSFTIMLLACSFFASWLIKSPGTGLVLAAFFVIGLTFGVNAFVGDFVEAADYSNRARQEVIWIIATYLSVSTLLFLGGWWLAGMRWAKGSVFAGAMRQGGEEYAAYIPVKQLSHASPGLYRALIWQCIKQARWIYLIVFLLCLFWIGNELLGDKVNRRSQSIELPNIIIGLIGGLLGVATFVGDTTKQRYRFLAERGLSAWTICWTRMIASIVLLIGLSVLAALCVLNTHQYYESFPYSIFAAFASFTLGSLASQWARRPIVGYLATPLLLFVSFAYCAFIYTLYPNYVGTMALGLAVLALSILRMTRRWCEGDRGLGFNGRFVGWIGLAALVLVVPIVAIRIWTTPPVMEDWRVETFAKASKLEFADQDLVLPEIVRLQVMYVDAGTYRLSGESINRLKQAIMEVRDGKIALLDWSEGLRSINWLLMSQNSVLEEFYRESGLTRNDVMKLAVTNIEYMSGKPLNLFMSDYLDQLEYSTARALLSTDNQKALGEEAVKDFAGRLRSSDQRRTDRRNALLLSWANHSSGSRRPSPFTYGFVDVKLLGDLLPIDDERLAERAYSFGGYWIPDPPKAIISFERARNLKTIDQATRFSLIQLDTGDLPSRFDSIYSKLSPSDLVSLSRIGYWNGVFDGRYGFFNEMYAPDPTNLWYAEVEQQIEQARALSGNESE